MHEKTETKMTRRQFLRNSLLMLATALCSVGGLLKPVVAYAARNMKAFSAETETDALSAFFPGQTITPSTDITLGVYDVIENGAVVPVQVTTTLPAVNSITLLVSKNPYPLIASFNLGPECSGFIATRIKVAKPAYIIAIVKSDGKLFSARKFVEVIEGGCGS